MERRAFATAGKVWAEAEMVCASEPTEFDDYVKTIGDATYVVDQLVGGVQRMAEYPQLDVAIEQDVREEDVHSAYESLIREGFTSKLRA